MAPRWMRILRIALPLAALALIVAIFAFPRPSLEGFDFDAAGLDVSGALRLDAPRFEGETPEGQPFTVRAEWALPDGPDPERIDLGPARAEIALSPERTATLTAKGGLFLPRARRVTLEGDVVATSSDGYRIIAPTAALDIDANRLDAAGPVRLRGPGAEMEAGAMTAERDESGDRVLFSGGVRMTLRPKLMQGGRP